MLRTLFVLNTNHISLKKVTSGVHWVFWEFAFWSVARTLLLKISRKLTRADETGSEGDSKTA